MNKLLKISLITFCFIILAGTKVPVIGQVAVRAVGIDGGWYSPSLDYWKDISRMSNWGHKFSGGIYGRAFLEIRLVKPVSVRIGVGYWSQTRSQGNITWGNETRKDELRLSLIPVTFDALAELNIESLSPIGFYGGIGGGINFIQMKFTRTPSISPGTSEGTSGRDYIGFLLAGVNIPMASGLATALEFRYVFGKYVQESYDPVQAIYENDVSITGPQITLALKYMFED
ncbi:hypothetical protein ACFLS9_08005 [Bacteroidota bacterium]